MNKLILNIFLILLWASSLSAQESARSFDTNSLTDYRFGWNNEQERLRERKWLKRAPNVIEDYEAHKLNPDHYAFDSFLLPGRGQLKLDQKGKGLLIRTTFFASMLYGLYEIARSNDYFQSYKSAQKLEDIEEYYEEANSSYIKGQVALGIGMAAWLYSIYDAYRQVEIYNINLFNDLRLAGLTPNFEYNIQNKSLSLSAELRF